MMAAFGRAAIAAVFLYLSVDLVAFWIGGARAGQGDGTGAGKGDLFPLATQSPSPELMAALMAWAAPRVGLPAPSIMPRIVRRDHCAMQAIWTPGVACPEPGSGVAALYADNVMWLRDDWRHDNLKDVSVLLHELVHHMQWHAGVDERPCKAKAIETPAYDAQIAFLEAAGVDPLATVGINPLMLMLVTSCMPQR